MGGHRLTDEVLLAMPTNSVKRFQRKSIGIDADVTFCAGRQTDMFLGEFAHSQALPIDRVGQFRDGGRWIGKMLSEKCFHDPVTPEHRAGS